MGFPGMVHTGAARAAVENMMRTLSVEWARFGIRMVAVAIGQFDTETLRTKYPKAIVENVANTVPLGRLGTEEEMAWLAAYLASPAGDFFSGCVITIDGARDNWFGQWPPGGAAGEGGEPLAEMAPAAERPGFAGYQFGVADEETTSNERTPIENLPETDANGVATFPVSLAKPPTSTRPQEAQIFIRMAEAGGRAVEPRRLGEEPGSQAFAYSYLSPAVSGATISALADVFFATAAYARSATRT